MQRLFPIAHMIIYYSHDKMERRWGRRQKQKILGQVRRPPDHIPSCHLLSGSRR